MLFPQFVDRFHKDFDAARVDGGARFAALFEPTSDDGAVRDGEAFFARFERHSRADKKGMVSQRVAELSNLLHVRDESRFLARNDDGVATFFAKADVFFDASTGQNRLILEPNAPQ